MNQTARLEVETPKGRQTIVLSCEESGLRLTELLRRENLPLNTRCAQRGLCDGCLVELLDGRLTRAGGGQSLDAVGAPVTVRGCEYRLAEGDSARIRIDARSLLAHEPQVVSEFRINIPYAHDPLAKDGWGAAIDIGTTTVALLLVDLRSGEIVGRAGGFNRQMHFGDDVLTRINLCMTNSSMLGRLQTAVIQETILPLLMEAGASLGQLKCITVAGNTTMLHLLAGVDPTPMGFVPFRPGFLDHRVVQLDELGSVDVHLLPGAAAYVGADLVAGIFATALAYEEGPSLLVDVGTNGEIILKHGKRLFGCATAAGPAFEGAGLTNGMRAADGAIEQIRMVKEPFAVSSEVIGDLPVSGICGSAYIDFLAEGRRVGILDENGRLDRAILADDRCHLAKNVFITELDIARLLQAKAAVAAGILTLLRRIDLVPSQIQRLYLAGGFGMHLDVANAIGCGLLPGFSPEQIQVVGNTSLAGAYLALVDANVVAELTRIGRTIDVVELNLDPGFESCYIDQLSLGPVS